MSPTATSPLIFVIVNDHSDNGKRGFPGTLAASKFASPLGCLVGKPFAARYSLVRLSTLSGAI
jgi:hypothetical protein